MVNPSDKNVQAVEDILTPIMKSLDPVLSATRLGKNAQVELDKFKQRGVPVRLDFKGVVYGVLVPVSSYQELEDHRKRVEELLLPANNGTATRGPRRTQQAKAPVLSEQTASKLRRLKQELDEVIRLRFRKLQHEDESRELDSKLETAISTKEKLKAELGDAAEHFLRISAWPKELTHD